MKKDIITTILKQIQQKQKSIYLYHLCQSIIHSYFPLRI